VFPADHGAHPEYRTEWWYATGGLRTAAGEVLGFQITFFRSRVDVNALVPVTPAPGRFAPRHLLLAHGALSDVAAQRQWHGQRLGRWNGDAAVRPHFAATTDTHVALGGWAMQRRDVGLADRVSEYLVKLDDAEFGFDLRLLTTQPLLLQGEAGWSRKGPNPAQASFYYSQPQLAVSGTVRRPGQPAAQAVTGTAWLDHEWSESVMPPDAVGWDWVGMNLDNGAALTAFQLRRADGSAVWAGGSWRAAAGAPTRVLTPQDLRWVPLRQWVSPSSQASYPVRWRLDTPMGVFEVHALLDAQELDSRQTTGTVYWEGLSVLREAVSGQRVGRGYLEMTGYAGRLNL
jgi:predicted secreted hydrolase